MLRSLPILLALLASTGCSEAVCGNGSVEDGEACDDGNDLDADNCSNACTTPRCGDGIIQEGEACDGGDGCVACGPICGDGIIIAGAEECDDGNDDPSDTCDDCDTVQCGGLVLNLDGSDPVLVTDPIGDFSLPLNGGRSWAFSAAYSGCDSYHFILHDGSSSYSAALIRSDLRGLFAEMPTNTHIFFGVYAQSAQRTLQSVRSIQALVEAGLERLSPAQRHKLDGRIHYIMEPVQGLVGPIGAIARRTPRDTLNYSFSIDRFARLREHGLLKDPTVRDSSADIRWIAEEAKGFDFEFERQQELEAQTEATIISLTEALPHRGGASVFEVELPSTESLSGFDLMSIDMLMDCPEHSHKNCNPWDYSAPLQLCGLGDREGCGDGARDEEAGEACDDGNTTSGDGCSAYCELEGDEGRMTWCPNPVEFAYWITTYKRPGRWVHDITPMLAHFQTGGKRRMRFHVGTNGKTYLLTIKLRLSASDAPFGRPSEAISMWSGGHYNEGYNDAQEPKVVAIPADVKRVEFVAHITGHGMSGAMNCSEFCAHNHRIQVAEGTVYEKDHSVADQQRGCQAGVGIGVVPNQFGTWPYGRAGWCPGLEVQPWRVDLTAELTPGSSHPMRYWSDVYGRPGTGGNIRMVSWLIYWR